MAANNYSREMARKAQIRAADERAEALRPLMEQAKRANLTLDATATWLNEQGIPSPSGLVGKWSPMAVSRVWDRLWPPACKLTLDMFDEG